MKNNGKTILFIFALFMVTVPLRSQTSDWGENTDQVIPFSGTDWDADSLFLGATFLRDTTKPFKVWLREGSGLQCELYLMVPTSPTTDTAIFLFYNINNPPGVETRVDLTNNAVIEQYVEHMDTVFFLLRRTQYGTYNGYTGPNRAPGDMCTQGDSLGACDGVDRYYSGEYSTTLVPTTDGRMVPIGRRWCVSGWIRDDALDMRTDTVEFGFEERRTMEPGFRSEWLDFNDIVFHITGIFLIKPSYATTLTLTVSDTAISAGTFATITGQISDQNDSVRTDLADSIEWFLDPATQVEGDSLTNARGDSTRFTSKVAYRTARVIGRYISDDTGEELRDTARIYIMSGPADHLVIQDAVGATDLYHDDPVGGGRLTLGSTETSTEDVYAVLRDEFGNYVQRSTQTAWDTLAGPELVVWASTGTDPSRGQGRIEKTFTQDQGATAVYARCLIPGYTGPSFNDTILVSIDPTTYDSLRIVDDGGGVLTQLTTTIDDSTLLFVEGRRTDNGKWTSVSGTWAMTPSLSPRIPPSSGPSWNFSPRDTGSAVIRVDRQTLSAQITVSVGAGEPERLQLYETPGMPDTNGNDPLPKYMSARAGDTVDIVAKLFDKQNNWLSIYEEQHSQGDQIRWAGDQIRGGTLIATQGAATSYLPVTAGLRDTIIAYFQKDLTTRLEDTLIVTVNPGPAEKIEIVYDTTSLGRVPVDIEFAQTDSLLTVYTVLRDYYGNFAGFADNSGWTSRDSADITAERGANTSYGEGIIRRTSDNEAYVWVVSSYYNVETSLWLYDSVNVHLTNISYDSLQIYEFSNGYVRADSLTLRTGEGKPLYAYGKHPIRGWEQVPAIWIKSAGLITEGDPPAWSNQWNVTAEDIGDGWITITRSGSVPDSIPVTFLPGDPNNLDIYDRPGDPAGLTPLSTVPIRAGTTLELYAKVFYGNEWFSQYENIDSSRKIFTWGIRKISGTAPAETLSTLEGHTTSFAPTAAYTLYRITAVFDNNGIRLVDSITVEVTPDTADHIVVERNRQPRLNADDPYDPISFDAGTGVVYPYAILRDRFGNYVANSSNTEWFSLDETVVTAQDGRIPQDGEGRIDRVGAIDTTRVIAWNADKPSNPTMYDTVMVILSNVTYDSLRIVSSPAGTERMTHLAVTAGEDTTIYVQGLRRFDTTWVVVDGDWTFSSPTL
ncbi:MAG: hypothetical protein GF401_02005, partial [Chitinivibrionales bacterium]|nr:hypothetical protein [Chitinivibrionales bacterium]